jgi:DNA processing protein
VDASGLEAWLRLTLAAGVGRGAMRRLLAAFGSPEAVLGASPQAWRDVAGASAAAALSHPDAAHAARLAAAKAWLTGGDDRSALTLGDPDYPAALLETADPPLLLYLLGDAGHLRTSCIAIVGSRNPTPQGLDNARQFAGHFAREGLAVVSGLALGIDGAAHEGALAASGVTIAVVGTGLDIVYPSRHQGLAHRIAASGLLVSEFAPGTPSVAANFPLRNRIIAGLSLGTLVVEAALRSGSLITARLAVEAGREVFAIPGSIHSPQSKGCHSLIRDGAKLVETAADVMEELRGWRPAAAALMPADGPALSAPADPLLEALGFDPVTLDALGARTGWPTADLLARLLTLELDGQVARLPGGLYQRRLNA